MGLGARWLVSFGLLVLPVAVTLGILFGLQARFEAGGGEGSFNGGNGDSGGGIQPINNEVDFERSCLIATGLGEHRTWKGQEYLLNPNQWGLKDGEKSSLCMDILWHNNGSYGQDSNTYASKYYAPKWQATWQYPQGSVHAFPNIGLSKIWPKKMQDVKSLKLDFEWTYANGNENKTTSDVELTQSSPVNANVAVDLFIDSDPKTAGNSQDARFEIMVWFAQLGSSTAPNGKVTSTTASLTDSVTGDEYTFDLWVGANPTGQNVFSWIPTKAIQKFSGDIYPLATAVLNVTEKGSAWPVGSDSIGYLAMGTECYYSPSNVTFYVPRFAIEVGTA